MNGNQDINCHVNDRWDICETMLSMFTPSSNKITTLPAGDQNENQKEYVSICHLEPDLSESEHDDYHVPNSSNPGDPVNFLNYECFSFKDARLSSSSEDIEESSLPKKFKLSKTRKPNKKYLRRGDRSNLDKEEEHNALVSHVEEFGICISQDVLSTLTVGRNIDSSIVEYAILSVLRSKSCRTNVNFFGVEQSDLIIANPELFGDEFKINSDTVDVPFLFLVKKIDIYCIFTVYCNERLVVQLCPFKSVVRSTYEFERQQLYKFVRLATGVSGLSMRFITKCPKLDGVNMEYDTPIALIQFIRDNYISIGYGYVFGGSGFQFDYNTVLASRHRLYHDLANKFEQKGVKVEEINFDDNDIFEVLSISSHYVTNGQFRFLVKWAGETESWENLNDVFCDEKIYEYFAKCGQNVPNVVQVHFDRLHMQNDGGIGLYYVHEGKKLKFYERIGRSGARPANVLCGSYNMLTIPEKLPEKENVYVLGGDGKYYKLCCPVNFYKSVATYASNKINNCVQSCIKHLTGIDLVSGFITESVSGYAFRQAQLYLLELKEFNNEHIRRINNRRLRMLKKKFKKVSGKANCPSEWFWRKKHLLKLMDIFVRGSGILLLEYASPKCNRDRHFLVVNLFFNYIYETGDFYLPFNLDEVDSEVKLMSTLSSNFGVQKVTRVFLVGDHITNRHVSYELLYGKINIESSNSRISMSSIELNEMVFGHQSQYGKNNCF